MATTGRRHRKRCTRQGRESCTLFSSGQAEPEWDGLGPPDFKAENLLIEPAVRKGDFGPKGSVWARASICLMVGSPWMLNNHSLFLLRALVPRTSMAAGGVGFRLHTGVLEVPREIVWG